MTMDGMDGRAKVTVLLTGGALSLDAAFAAVVSPACGGTALFVGTTRSPNQGREVEELEYEAYQELARPALERVARAAAARHGLGAVYLAHRVGAVPRAEPSVIVAGAAGSACPTRRWRRRSLVGARVDDHRVMVDSFGRVVRDLRVSVTDRCNFRCLYCMPAEGLPWLPTEDVLSHEELVRALRIAVELGVRTIRVTGGEPTLRRDLVDVVGALSGLGVELSLTTNGYLMDRLAAPLAEAGLDRVNISLDSLRRERFKEMARRDGFERVLAGIDATLAAGLRPVKINTVMVRGFNDDEIEPMAGWARDLGVELRFIEFMPLDAPGDWTRDQVVPAGQILARLDQAFGLVTPTGPRGSAPAE